VREVLKKVEAWRDAGQAVALATVVKTEGSAPRRAGARLALSDDGEMAGSVSGGCVENDVIYHAQQALETGEPTLLRYDISGDMVWDVGLACGGALEVWVERLEAEDPLQVALERALNAGRTVAQALCLEGAGTPGAKRLVWPTGKTMGSLGDGALDQQATADAQDMLAQPGAALYEYKDPAARVFIEVFPPPPHLVIFGGVHAAIPLTTFAKTLGYLVTVIDPRRQFANRERFPHADQVIAAWPQKAVEQLEMGPMTFCAILTHDPKIDEPALKGVLGRGAGYVGAIGSRKTHAERFERMAKHGVSADQLGEVYAPIGLDLGAKTPEEIALAVMAEIVAVRRGAPGGFLRDG
jgi:xanthine dehydrogenase accessory factor